MLILLLSLACGPRPCDVGDLASGSLLATVDGLSWSATGASWSESGDGVQIITADEGGWRLTLVAQLTADGEAVLGALEDGKEVEVPMGSGSFAALYPSGESISYAAKEAEDGQVRLRREGDELQACFEFTATAADESIATLDGGTLRAACVGCP